MCLGEHLVLTNIVFRHTAARILHRLFEVVAAERGEGEAPLQSELHAAQPKHAGEFLGRDQPRKEFSNSAQTPRQGQSQGHGPGTAAAGKNRSMRSSGTIIFGVCATPFLQG